jgi:hypothetical protein
MCPKGIASNIFFSALFLTTNYPLSLDTSYEKLRAELTGKHSSLIAAAQHKAELFHIYKLTKIKKNTLSCQAN